MTPLHDGSLLAPLESAIVMPSKPKHHSHVFDWQASVRVDFERGRELATTSLEATALLEGVWPLAGTLQ